MHGAAQASSSCFVVPICDHADFKGTCETAEPSSSHAGYIGT